MYSYKKTQYKINDVISFIERRYFDGAGYLNAGFKKISTTAPNYYYFLRNKYDKLYNRINFQKHKLKDKLVVFDANLTEKENMFRNKFLWIYDAGSIKVHKIL